MRLALRILGLRQTRVRAKFRLRVFKDKKLTPKSLKCIIIIYYTLFECGCAERKCSISAGNNNWTLTRFYKLFHI